MKRGVFPAALGCLVGGLLLWQGGALAAEPLRLSFLFTNDVQGYIEPCG